MQTSSARPLLLAAPLARRAGTVALLALACAAPAHATNPLILDQFTADPTARVFEGKVYVYPSHDIPTPPGKGRPNWFCMEDYHVFSSENLTDWTDHGVIVTQTGVDWVKPDGYSMWAPDCVEKNGHYYFYFPAVPKSGMRGFNIGVAIADHPYGPFKPNPTPIPGVGGIDPCVLIDRDGSAYLYVARGGVFVAKLKDNMQEIEGALQKIDNLPTKGLVEGPFVFERNGIYYLTYPHVEHVTERLEYATSDHPMGPFKPAGVILDESPTGCWTVHQSIVQFKGQWYLFYHDKDLSPDFDKNRAIRADRLEFAEDGSIRKVIPTLRGVGLVNATSHIEIDRYSEKSADGVNVSFVDPKAPRFGWKVSLTQPNAWVRFNAVDFKRADLHSLTVRYASAAGARIEIRLDRPDAPPLASVSLAPSADLNNARVTVKPPASGVHDIFVHQTGSNAVDLDWISFE